MRVAIRLSVLIVNRPFKWYTQFTMCGQKKTVAMVSQGCRLNHSETAHILNEFKSHQVSEVGLEDDPEIVVINTCTVTENGDKDTQKLIKKINHLCTRPKIALIGCQSQIKKKDLLQLQNVHWVIGNNQKNKTVELIMNAQPGVYVDTIQKQSFTQPYSSFDPKHTRVNLKIQDGCDFYCSFCIIPFARGPARSRDFYNILDDAKALIHLGVKELVLNGINLGTYSNQGYQFYDLLIALLELSPKTRIRISSIEPTTIDERLIDIWLKYPNFCRYLHLPIQSATDTILKKMRRKYSVSDYLTYVSEIKNKIPNICIGTDIIVGFPGETDELFNQTKDTLEAADIHYFHVFSYSERTMAHSRKFDQQIDQSIIKKRSLALRNLHQKKWTQFLTDQMNSTQEVLFEQEKLGIWVGRTEHFIKVGVSSKISLKNKLKSVKLIGIDNDTMKGQLI